MTLDDVPDIEKAYSDDELDRLLLRIQLKEITLCETCDVFFKYVPQKRFCDTCKASPEAKERKREYRQRPEAKERKREYDRKHKPEYGRRPEVKERAREYRQRPEVKERKRQYSREYYKKNREKLLEYHRNRYHRRKKGEEE